MAMMTLRSGGRKINFPIYCNKFVVAIWFVINWLSENKLSVLSKPSINSSLT